MAFLAVQTVASAAESANSVVATLPGARSKTSAFFDPRPGSGACTQGCAYVFGGGAQSDLYDQIVRVDPATGQTLLMEVNNRPDNLEWTSAAWADTRAFIVGGLEGRTSARDSIEVYDPKADTLNLAERRLPSPRYQTSTVWNGTWLFVFGGLDSNGDVLDQIFWYDPVAQTRFWGGQSLPSPRTGTSAVWTGEKAYLFGGRRGETYLNTIVEFDPGAPGQGTLRLLDARFPTGRAYTSAAWDGRYAYVFGGSNGASQFLEVYRFDPIREALERWNADLAAPRSETSAAWTGNASLVFGGYTGGQWLDEVVSYNASTAGPGTPKPGPATPPSKASSSPIPPGARDRDGARVEPLVLLVGGALALAVPAGLLVLRAWRASRPRVTSGRPVRGGASYAGRPATLRGVAEAAALSVRDLTVRLEGRPIVQAASFEVPRSSITFLLGPSGSGKSTLLRALVGLAPSIGEVLIDQRPVRLGSRDVLTRVGYVPQDLQLYEHLHALENVTYFAGQYGLPARVAEERGRALLGDLGLGDRVEERLNRLSGGQRRRVSIAAALVHEPALLLLDEPTSGLDFSSRKTLWGVLQRLVRNRPVGVLATTHFIDDVQYGDSVGVMFEGRLVAFGTPRELVRSLPGGGRCVEVEFEELDPADRRRWEALLPQFQAKKLVERADLHTFRARCFGSDPSRANRVLADELFRQGFRVRSVRLDDVTLEDVFVWYTGRPWEANER